MTPDCPHYSAGCLLKLHGGQPLPGNCRACIAAGENNPDYAAALFARFERSHPPDRPRVSGCCDDARNPV